MNNPAPQSGHPQIPEDQLVSFTLLLTLNFIAVNLFFFNFDLF